jgi:hypothetical protein
MLLDETCSDLHAEAYMVEINTSGQSVASIDGDAASAADMAGHSDADNRARDTPDPATSGAMRVAHRGVVLTVTAHRNSEGAWLAAISASVDGQPLDLPHVEPATPEWLTESEALRAGIEHGCYLVDRYVPHR